MHFFNYTFFLLNIMSELEDRNRMNRIVLKAEKKYYMYIRILVFIIVRISSDILQWDINFKRSIPCRALLTAAMLSALEQSASGPLRYAIMRITSGKYLSCFSLHPRKIVWLIVFHCDPRAVCCLWACVHREKYTVVYYGIAR